MAELLSATGSFITFMFRLNPCKARWEAVRTIFYENRMTPVYKPLDAKLV